jgi:hypothetical protein
MAIYILITILFISAFVFVGMLPNILTDRRARTRLLNLQPEEVVIAEPRIHYPPKFTIQKRSLEKEVHEDEQYYIYSKKGEKLLEKCLASQSRASQASSQIIKGTSF